MFMKLGEQNIYDDIFFLLDKCESGSWCLNGCDDPECCTDGCKSNFEKLPAKDAYTWNDYSCDAAPSMLTVPQYDGVWPIVAASSGVFAPPQTPDSSDRGSTCNSCGSDRRSGTGQECCSKQHACYGQDGARISYEWKEAPGSGNCRCRSAGWQCWCDGEIKKAYKCDTSSVDAKCTEAYDGEYPNIEACQAAIASGECGIKYSCKLETWDNVVCYEDPEGNYNGKTACEESIFCKIKYKCSMEVGSGTNESSCNQTLNSGYATEAECCDNCCGACADSIGRCEWYGSADGAYGAFSTPTKFCAMMTRDQCVSQYSSQNSTFFYGESATFQCCTGSSDCNCDGYEKCPSCPEGKRQVVPRGDSWMGGAGDCSCVDDCPACPFGQQRGTRDDTPCAPCVPCGCAAGEYLANTSGPLARGCDCTPCDAKHGGCTRGDFVVNSDNQCQCVEDGKVVWP